MRLATALAILLVASSSYGQGQVVPRPSTRDDARMLETIVTRSQDPTMTSSITGTNPAAVLEIGTEKKTLKAKIGKRFGRALANFTLSGPIDEDADDATLATLDGLATSYAAAVGITWTSFTHPPKHDLEKASPFCAEYARRNRRPFDPLKDSCDDEFLKDDPVAARQLEAILWGNAPIDLFNATFQVGRKEFKYLTSETFSDAQDTHNPISAGVTYGRLTGDSLWAVGLRYEKTYRPEDKRRICLALAGTASATECKELPVGAPKSKEGGIAFVEQRTFRSNFATNPRLSRNFNTHGTGIDLPVYFLKNSDGQFAGGIRLGLLSERARNGKRDNTVTLAVFYSALSSLLP